MSAENRSKSAGTARHGYAIDHACLPTYERLGKYPCRHTGVWLRHRRVGVSYNTPTEMIVSVFTYWYDSCAWKWSSKRYEASTPIRFDRSDIRLVARAAMRDRFNDKHNACAFPKTRPFGPNNARARLSSDISPTRGLRIGRLVIITIIETRFISHRDQSVPEQAETFKSLRVRLARPYGSGGYSGKKNTNVLTPPPAANARQNDVHTPETLLLFISSFHSIITAMINAWEWNSTPSDSSSCVCKRARVYFRRESFKKHGNRLRARVYPNLISDCVDDVTLIKREK